MLYEERPDLFEIFFFLNIIKGIPALISHTDSLFPVSILFLRKVQSKTKQKVR